MPISITCSTCNKKLKVPDAAAGKKVRCPACKAVVMVPVPEEELVAPDDDLVEPDEDTAISEAPPPPKKKAAWDKGSPNEEKPPNEEDEGYGLDEEDEADRKRRKKKQRRRFEEEEEDRADRRSRRGEPHRAVLIVVLGIVAMCGACLCAFVGWGVGGIVLNMANTDLAKMQNKSMDPSGQGMTTAGKAFALIAIGLGLINAILGVYLRMSDRKF
jgi:LSD1 subclass zinc finger protein